MLDTILSTAVDCGKLDDPDYGEVDVSSTTYRSMATYTCRHGYYLVGEKTRLCLYNAKWGAYAPVCKRKFTVHEGVCDSMHWNWHKRGVNVLY